MKIYDEYGFKLRVNSALDKVKTILDNTRLPQYPSEVHHEYEDKYILSEFLANSAIASFLNSLELLGFNGKNWEQLKEWSNNKNITLRLRSEETCKFLRKTEREVESDTKNVTKAGVFGKFESFTVTKVTEYLWQFTVKWELVAFAGVDVDKAITLQSRTGAVEMKTVADTTPRPETVVQPPKDVNITWLLQHTDATKTPKFSIDRKSKKCHTPRRNLEVTAALNFLSAFHSWVTDVRGYFFSSVFSHQLEYDMSSINGDAVFVPVLPLFEDPSSSSSSSTTITTTASHSSSKIPPVFMNSFLAEQARSLDEKWKNISKTFPSNEKLVTPAEAHLLVTLLHLNRVSEAYSEGVDYIEDLLYKQLVAAIGKEVTPVDFTNYLTFHNRKVFHEAYRPQAFSYAIRRPDHYPEGILSIEAQLDDGVLSSPISTIVAHRTAARPMRFSLNAATKVSFFGDRYLHGYVSHQFAGYSGTQLSLCARARQFSSFILLVGRIASADLFEPKYATIIQNKDDLKIPLLLETIPTPKEFKDAIASLSPEQQRFCKAFRSMQLESTLFGVCVIQIKPQLEKLLKLPDDSLTKEIQLSQDLLNLFIKYQIPSDLVSYDGPEGESIEHKTGRVKEYVARMHAMLEGAKKAELDEARRIQEMRLAQEENDRRKAEQEKERLRIEKQLKDTQKMMNENIDSLLSRSESLQTESARFMAPAKSQGRSWGLPSLNFFARGSARSPAANNNPLYSSDINSASNPLYSDGGGGGGFSYGGSGGGGGGGGMDLLDRGSVSSASEIAAPPEMEIMESEAIEPEPSPSEVPKDAPQEQANKPDQPHQQEKNQELVNASQEVVDYTKIPNILERKFEQFDENNALRPTIINPGNTWSKTFYKSLLSEAETKTIDTQEQEKEKNKAFDLLDALTKSGALSVEAASLHVVIASTHCFDKSIIQTIIQDNINPIEKVENSSLIVASTIHQTPAINLIAHEHLDRISTTSARLLENSK